MKKILYVLIFIGFTSCDYVEAPIPQPEGQWIWDLYPGSIFDYPYDFSNPASNWSANTNTKQNILLEGVEFERCRQKEGEDFKNFYINVQQYAIDVDLCKDYYNVCKIL